MEPLVCHDFTSSTKTMAEIYREVAEKLNYDEENIQALLELKVHLYSIQNRDDEKYLYLSIDFNKCNACLEAWKQIHFEVLIKKNIPILFQDIVLKAPDRIYFVNRHSHLSSEMHIKSMENFKGENVFSKIGRVYKKRNKDVYMAYHRRYMEGYRCTDKKQNEKKPDEISENQQVTNKNKSFQSESIKIEEQIVHQGTSQKKQSVQKSAVYPQKAAFINQNLIPNNNYFAPNYYYNTFLQPDPESFTIFKDNSQHKLFQNLIPNNQKLDYQSNYLGLNQTFSLQEQQKQQLYAHLNQLATPGFGQFNFIDACYQGMKQINCERQKAVKKSNQKRKK